MKTANWDERVLIGAAKNFRLGRAEISSWMGIRIRYPHFHYFQRHLEIIVPYTKTIEKDYSKFISFANNSLNHLTFYNQNEGLFEFWKDTTICRSNVSSRKITDKPRFIGTKTTSSPTGVETSHPAMKLIWWVASGVGLILMVVGVVIGGRYIYVKQAKHKRMSFIREKADSITSWTEIPHNEKYWKLLLNDEDIIINTETTLGKGATAMVFPGKGFQKYRRTRNNSSVFQQFSKQRMPSGFFPLQKSLRKFRRVLR